MKTLPLAVTAAFGLSLTLLACGSSSSASPEAGSDTESADLSSDTCRKPALAAAEAAYGNDPIGTRTKALTVGKRYFVTVGIRNVEDGPHDYYVDFTGGCQSIPKVSEVPFFPHPLRNVSHTAYEAVLFANGDAMDPALAIEARTLPVVARRQFATWLSDTASCSAVNAYKVSVKGQDTFAVTCAVVSDSIKLSLAIYDDAGSSIDQASIYGITSKVGNKGVSWQNEVFEEQQ